MRSKEAEQRIGDVEDKIMANNEAKKKRETKIVDHDDRLRELSNSLMHNNMCIRGVPEDGEIEKGEEGLSEQITAQNSPNLGKDTDIEIQEVQRTLIKFNKSWSSPRHITVRFTKYQTRKKS